jgi:hypothetical protein
MLRWMRRVEAFLAYITIKASRRTEIRSVHRYEVRCSLLALYLASLARQTRPDGPGTLLRPVEMPSRPGARR